jgi:hypothetical protein
MKISSLIKKGWIDTIEQIHSSFDGGDKASDEFEDMERDAMLLVSLGSHHLRNDSSSIIHNSITPEICTKPEYQSFLHSHTLGYETSVIHNTYQNTLPYQINVSERGDDNYPFVTPSKAFYLGNQSEQKPVDFKSSVMQSQYKESSREKRYREELSLSPPKNLERSETTNNIWTTTTSLLVKSLCKKHKKDRNKRRLRTTPEQLKILEEIYLYEKIPSLALREELAAKLGMTPRRIQVWFQNKRAKERRTGKEKPSVGSDNESSNS